MYGTFPEIEARSGRKREWWVNWQECWAPHGKRQIKLVKGKQPEKRERGRRC